MRGPVYTVDDVQSFIAQQDCGFWSRGIYDVSKGKFRDATEEDLADYKINTFEILGNYDKEYKMFSMSNYNFGEVDPNSKLYGGESKLKANMSIAWCGYLLENYGVDYANMLTNWSTHNIDQYEAQKENASATEKRMIENAVRYYSRLREMASEVILGAENSAEASA